MSEPTKQSVAVVIHRDDPADEFLVVQRPADDAELPGIWGLPAATLRAGETWPDAVRRTGQEKLGVDLRPLGALCQGEAGRGHYSLQMRLYAAEASGGQPEVPQPHGGVTQYTAWRWGKIGDLVEGARMGSLCCRLMMESAGAEWREHGP